MCFALLKIVQEYSFVYVCSTVVDSRRKRVYIWPIAFALFVYWLIVDCLLLIVDC